MSKRTIYTAELLRVLRMERSVYMDMLLDEGRRYLDLYLGEDSESRNVLAAMPEYWEWWMTQADHRCSRFFVEHGLPEWASYVGKYERVLLTKLFYELHAADMLQETMRPPRHVMRPAIDILRERVTSAAKAVSNRPHGARKAH